jgi:AcrR family transcriptional regulator
MKNETKQAGKDETIRRPRGRPRTSSKDEKRAAVITEARRTFHEQGYAGTTMDLVAARCKISKQTLYALFASKTELFMAMIATHRASMLDLPRDEDENLPLAEALEKIFMIDMDEEADRDRRAFVHFIVGEAEQFPEIVSLLVEHGIEPSRRMLADWLQVQNDRGLLDVAHTMSGARMLLSMIMSAVAPLPGSPDKWSNRQERDEHIRRCFDMFLYGAVPRSAGRKKG